MKFISLLACLTIFSFSFGQSLHWQTLVDTATTFSSPRATDLTNDGVLDIIIGGGLDGTADARGVVALNGSDGSIIWNFPTNEEIFASPIFQDINGDNISDVFIGGRYAELYAIDGATGNQIWEFFEGDPTTAVDSGWFNFYSLQFVPDQNNDSYPDLLASNGGNHALPSWDTDRDPGYLMIIDALTGEVLAQDTMPDGEETYCSPVIYDLEDDGSLDIIYGSGGENDKGSLWRTKLADLMNNDISGSTELVTDPALGFIAPVSLADFNQDNTKDIVCQSYSGTVFLIDGLNNSILWSYDKGGVESSSSPTIGNFIGDATPDVFVNLAKGAAPSFFDYYQVVLDGATGEVAWQDSIGQLHFASSGAVDLDHNGRDEIIASLNYHNGSNFSNELIAIDVQGDQVTSIYGPEGGVNLGSSPLIVDVEQDGMIDFVYAFRADSTNPMGAKGFNVNKISTPYEIPAVGVAWGSYMGTQFNGVYNYQGQNCGTLSASVTAISPSCNDSADGYIKIIPTGGMEPYNFVWSTGGITDSIGGLAAGSYTGTLTDSAGCFVTQTFTLTDPYIINFGGIVSPTCPGDSNGLASVSSSGCPCMFSGCTYEWSNGDSIKNANGLPAGIATVSITHLDGCIVTDTVLIPEALPILDSINIIHQQCATAGFGTGIIELIVNDSANTIYTWDDGDTMALHDSLSVGMHYVDMRDNRGCVDSAWVDILPVDSITANLTGFDISCYGLIDGVINAAPNGGQAPFEFSWSNGSDSSTVNGLGSGYHSVTITDSLGCVITDSIMIVEPDSLELQLNGINESGLCDGEAGVIVSGGTLPYTYLWNESSTTSDLVNLCEGTYSVEVTDANGCLMMDSIELLSTIGTAENDINFNIYPNPSEGHFFISNEKGLEVQVSVISMLGEVVEEVLTSKNVIELDLTDLAKGVYIVRLTSDNEMMGEVKLEKL